MAQDLPVDQFTFTDRLYIAWSLAWPCAAIGLIYELSKGPLHIRQYGWIDVPAALLQLFLIAPWVVRRTVRLEFPRVQLTVIRRETGERTRAMRYRESLKVAWALINRSVGLGMLILTPIIATIAILRGGLSDLETRSATLPAQLLGEAFSLLVEVFLFVLVLKSVVRAPYREFALGLETAGAAEEPGGISPVQPLTTE